jgi:hypothetical protein
MTEPTLRATAQALVDHIESEMEVSSSLALTLRPRDVKPLLAEVRVQLVAAAVREKEARDLIDSLRGAAMAFVTAQTIAAKALHDADQKEYTEELIGMLRFGDG